MMLSWIYLIHVLGKANKSTLKWKENKFYLECLDGNYFPGGIYFCKLVFNGFWEGEWFWIEIRI